MRNFSRLKPYKVRGNKGVDMPISQDHVSFAQLNMLLKCGEQYRRRYIMGHIVPPAGALMRGRCCHKAEADNFTCKIQTKEFLTADQVKDIFVDDWTANEGQIGWQEDELEGESPKKASGRMKDSGVRLIEVFHAEQLQNCDPVEIESDFTVEFQGGYKPMVGRIDRIDKDDVIAEEKFVKKSPVADDILTDVQMTAYHVGHTAKFGRPPKMLQKQWAVDTKTPKTVIQTCSPRPDEQIQRFLRRLELGMTAIEKGMFLPAQPGWWCSEKFCGYWATCKVRP
jgi:hypothetical protein